MNVVAQFLRKDVFEKVGAFNERLVAAEDYDLHNRLLRHGFRIGYIKSKEIHADEPGSLPEVIRKHYYYGKTLKKFLDSNRERDIKQISPIRPAFVKNWKNLAYNPILTIGFVIYQTVRYIPAGLGFLVTKFEQSGKEHIS